MGLQVPWFNLFVGLVQRGMFFCNKNEPFETMEESLNLKTKPTKCVIPKSVKVGRLSEWRYSTQKLQGKSISSIVLTLSCNPRYDMDFDPCGDTVALTKAKP